MLLWLGAGGGGSQSEALSSLHLLILEADVEALLDTLIEHRKSGRRLPGR